MVIADEAVDARWATPLARSLETVARLPIRIRVSQATVPSGETSKSMAQFERLLRWMLGGGRRSSKCCDRSRRRCGR